MLRIFLTGAARTGKSQLAADLTRALQASEQKAFVVEANTPALLSSPSQNDLTLLMGLKVRPASPIPTETQEAQEAEDRAIRAALGSAGVPYQVIYGEGEERTTQALEAAQRMAPRAAKPIRPGSDASKPETHTRAWTWMCDKCSDPQCEHRLLTALLAQRASAA